MSLFLLLLTSCIKEDQSGADLSVGDRLPDFTAVMNDGSQITGVQLQTGVSCIVFFTTGCPDCQKALPHIQRVYDEYVSQDIQFVLISREESDESVARYWAEQGLTMPYSPQQDRSIYELFAKTRVPRIYICRDGIIQSIFTDEPAPTYESIVAELNNIKL